MTKTPVLLTGQEVADAARVSRLTVNRWAREKRIPARKVGNQWLFAEPDVLRFLGGEAS